jgi:hypothetical protein
MSAKSCWLLDDDPSQQEIPRWSRERKIVRLDLPLQCTFVVATDYGLDRFHRIAEEVARREPNRRWCTHVYPKYRTNRLETEQNTDGVLNIPLDDRSYHDIWRSQVWLHPMDVRERTDSVDNDRFYSRTKKLQ